MTDDLMAKVTAELSYGLACHDVQISGTAEKFIADRILAIAEIAEALSRPTVTPLADGGYMVRGGRVTFSSMPDFTDFRPLG